MLTLSCARLAFTSRAVALMSGVLTFSILGLGVASADGVAAVGGCVRTYRSFNCAVRWGPATDPFIRTVPQPADKLEKDRAAERDQKWQERCRPIIMQDRYGVPRYRYFAPGCEFGVIE